MFAPTRQLESLPLSTGQRPLALRASRQEASTPGLLLISIATKDMLDAYPSWDGSSRAGGAGRKCRCVKRPEGATEPPSLGLQGVGVVVGVEDPVATRASWVHTVHTPSVPLVNSHADCLAVPAVRVDLHEQLLFLLLPHQGRRERERT